MNKFIAQKLGEVLAFANVGNSTLEKGKEALLNIVDTSVLEGSVDTLNALAQRIEDIASEEGVASEVHAQAQETQKKVTSMRDTYIGDEWSEASEVLEWMGFYTGASLVHWHLIAGAANELELEELAELSADALDFYNSLFAADEEVLQEIGADSSSE